MGIRVNESKVLRCFESCNSREQKEMVQKWSKRLADKGMITNQFWMFYIWRRLPPKRESIVI